MVVNMICSYCGLKYDPDKNVKYKHSNYCSFKCKEDYIDAWTMVSGVYEQCKQGDLFDHVGKWDEGGKP
jgi:hypothetical protein